MIRRVLFLTILTFVQGPFLKAQEVGSAEPRHIRLDEAVQLALQHNHVIRISRAQVEEKHQAKNVARSAYWSARRFLYQWR
jgi:hypothetical protein